MKRSVTLLGATGSVGKSACDVLVRHRDRFSVEAVVAGSKTAELAKVAKFLGARFAAVADENAFDDLATALAGSGIACGAGPAAVAEAAARPADIVLAAIVGTAGLEPTLVAARRGATIALANKECLVSAGSLFMSEVRRGGATVLPTDSEHNAIFQVLDGQRRESAEEIILTASGGPFRTFSLDDMATVGPEQALRHPNWSMGAKITIDSATLMNKGLELIEARHLFAVAPERLSVVVHPQSIVHGLVRWTDGTVTALLAPPDMRLPILHCFAWPERLPNPGPELDLVRLGRLDFEAPDPTRFPALVLAREAMERGGGRATALNAANEIAVAAFLNRRLGFLDIVRVVEETLANLDRRGHLSEPADLEAVRVLDAESRRTATGLLHGRGATVS